MELEDKNDFCVKKPLSSTVNSPNLNSRTIEEEKIPLNFLNSCLLFIIDMSTNLFFLKKFSYVEKIRFLALVLISLVFLIVFTFCSIVYVLTTITMMDAVFYTTLSILIGIIVSFFFGLCLFITFKNSTLFFFLVNVFVTAGCITIHIVNLKDWGGIIGGSPLCILPSIYMLVFIFVPKNHLNINIMWIFCALLLYPIFFIIDICFVDLNTFTSSLLNRINLPIEVIVIHYITLGANLIISFSVLIFLHERIKSFSNIAVNIGTVISMLNLDSKHVKTLVGKPKRICTSFEILLKKLVQNMKIFRACLPDIVWNQCKIKFSNGDSCSSEENLSSESTHTEDSGRVNDVIKITVRSPITKKNKVLRTENDKIIDFGMKEKEVILCDVCIINFEMIIEECENAINVERFLIKYSSVVSSVVHFYGGLVHEIVADKIRISFNSQRICMNGEKKALKCAMKIEKKLKEIGISPRIVIINDKMYVGNVKISKEKIKYYIISKRDKEMEEIRALETHRCILICKDVRESVKFFYDTKPVFVWNGDKIYYGIERKRKIKPGEWIYELDREFVEKNDKNKRVSEYQKAWEYFIKGDVKDSMEILKKLKENDEDAKFLLKHAATELKRSC